MPKKHDLPKRPADRKTPWGGANLVWSLIAAAAVTSSLLFFVLTNLGVWAFGHMYPKTAAGLIACYTAALPFFRNTLEGDLLYTLVLFGGFALLERRFAVLREPQTPSALALA
jgi:hypothetical protein